MINQEFIEYFHMTSRRPYWCPKTMKLRPSWCSKLVLWELNSFLMQTLSFVPLNLHSCWPREWKRSTVYIMEYRGEVTIETVNVKRTLSSKTKGKEYKADCFFFSSLFFLSFFFSRTYKSAIQVKTKLSHLEIIPAW